MVVLILFLDSSRFSPSVALIFVENYCFLTIFGPFYFLKRIVFETNCFRAVCIPRIHSSPRIKFTAFQHMGANYLSEVTRNQIQAAAYVPWGTRHGKRVNGWVGSPCASTGNPPVCFHGEPTWGAHLRVRTHQGNQIWDSQNTWYTIAVRMSQMETHTPFHPPYILFPGQGFGLGCSLYSGLLARHRNRIPGGSALGAYGLSHLGNVSAPGASGLSLLRDVSAPSASGGVGGGHT